jgi:hypothetical protein
MRLPGVIVAILAAVALLSGCRPKPTAAPVALGSGKSSVAADDQGIHFLGKGGVEIVVVSWGEIRSVSAVRWPRPDGSNFLDVYIDHFSGVDFTFTDVEDGYDQVMAAMEQHLVGFTRARVEAAPPPVPEKLGWVDAWKRDERVQPFQLSPLKVDNRAPTEEERALMRSAHQASIDSCERILGRPLDASELACIHTEFKNGEIAGGISPPLSEKLVSRQAQKNAEILRRKSGK